MNQSLNMNWLAGKRKQAKTKYLPLMDVEAIKKVRDFHKTLDQYSVTPLQSLPHLAAKFNVGGIYVKDESSRFGLNSFKALGSTYALSKIMNEMTVSSNTPLTFYATTDGNHGRAVAWAAAKLGHKSIIYMPKGSPEVKLENIRREGGEAYITDMNYDDTIRYTAALAEKTPGGIIVQDTAWENYTDIPGWIMQGYSVMALEACEQLQNIKPTHMLLQAGTGAFAGSALGLAANFYENSCPTTIIVEPTVADCHYRSAASDEIVNIGGDMQTIMEGLACGEPNILSWDIINNWASYFVSMDDKSAALGMRTLGIPLPGDPRIISGESGASTMGCLMEILTHNKELRHHAGINQDSHILLFSTEGDTNPESYKEILWTKDYQK